MTAATMRAPLKKSLHFSQYVIRILSLTVIFSLAGHLNVIFSVL